MKQAFILVCCLIQSALIGQETFDSLIYASDVEVRFDSDVYTLDASAIAILDSFSMHYAAQLFHFTIHAHTDDVGSDQYNIELSNKRALALKDHLLTHGIEEKQIQIQYFGEKAPVKPNDSELGRQANRRATIKAFNLLELQWLTGMVKDEESGLGIPAHIKLHSKTFDNQTRSDSLGFFKIAAPTGEVVGLDIRAKGFLLETKMLRVKPLMSTRPIEVSIPKIVIGKGFNLNRLFFEGNKDVLKENSMDVFNELLYFVQENDTFCIEIGGHINLPHARPVDRNTWNMHLSIARAKKVHDLLVQHNIVNDRLVYKGYGNWKMKYPEAVTESQMEKNRRVEIVIIDCSQARSEPNDSIPPGRDFSTGKRYLLNNKVD